MQIESAILNLNAKFVYKSDTGDDWKILRDEGKIYGDCEDYSLTLAWLICDKSILKLIIAFLTMRFTLWYGHTPSGEGHALLYIRGYGWIDNIQQTLTTKKSLKIKGYKFRFPFLPPLFFLKWGMSKIL